MNKHLKAAIVLLPVFAMSGCFPPGGGAELPASPKSETFCPTKTMDVFLKEHEKDIKKLHAVEGAPLDKFMAAVNQYRARSGFPAWRSNMMLIGELVSGELGVALFQDGCMIQGSTYAADAATIVKMFEFNDSIDILKKLNIMPGDPA